MKFAMILFAVTGNFLATLKPSRAWRGNFTRGGKMSHADGKIRSEYYMYCTILVRVP